MSEELKNSPVENFDWDAFEKGEVYGDKSHDELVNTYDQSLNTVKDKEVIEGTVIALNKRAVVVNIGYKSDGVISMNEFRYNPDLKVGDTVEQGETLYRIHSCNSTDFAFANSVVDGYTGYEISGRGGY